MKKSLFISLPALLITGVLSVLGVSHAIATPSSEVVTYAQPISKPVEAPRVVEAVIEQPIVQEPVVEPYIVSNEDLKVQYGWTLGACKDSINYIMGRYPEYFTDTNRERSFQYLKEVGDVQANLTWVYVYMLGHREASAWADVGTRSSVSY